MTSTTLTLPTDTTILVQRRFDAPIELVYAAHMEPQHVTKWLTGPDGWKLTEAQMDVRTGGTYVWNYTGPEDKTMTLPDQATRDIVVSQGGMESGYHTSHAQLDELLATVS